MSTAAEFPTLRPSRFWRLLLSASILVLVMGASLHAFGTEPINEMVAAGKQVDAFDAQAKALMSAIEAVTVPGQLPPLWSQALMLEKQVLNAAQPGLTLAQSVFDPSDLMKKKIIIYEKITVRVVIEIEICKLLILQLQEEFGVPTLPIEPEVQPLLDLGYIDLRSLANDAKSLLGQVEGVTQKNQLPPLWAAALGLEQQAFDLLHTALDTGLNVGMPSEVLEKAIIIVEDIWVKVIVWIVVIKETVLELQEEFDNPIPPPDQPTINQVLALIGQMQGADTQACQLLDGLITDQGNPSTYNSYWASALALEEQALPLVQQGVDAAQLVANPSELLIKKISILEAWESLTVIEIKILKITIILLRELNGVPPGVPEQPQLNQVLSLIGNYKVMEAHADALVDEIEQNVLYPSNIPTYFGQILGAEEQALPALQQGIDVAQTLSNPSELLQKKIAILEVWHVKVTIVLNIAKVIELQLFEEFQKYGQFLNIGDGLKGTFGIPCLQGNGQLTGNSPLSLSLSNTLPFAPAFLLLGFSELDLPFKGGIVVPDFTTGFLLPLPVGPAGSITVNSQWPTGIPPGLLTYYQYWIKDAGGPFGFSASNALRAATP